MIHKNYTIRFILHRRKDTPRQHLQMRVTPRGGKPVSFTTGVSLTDAEWDSLLGRAKGRTPEAADANTLIMQWSSVVADLFKRYDSLQIVPTAEQLKKDFSRATVEDGMVETYTPQPTAQMTLMAAYTQFMLDSRSDKSWSDGTVDTLQSFRRLLSEFMPDVKLSEVDEAYLMKFHRWLVDDRQQQNVTVHNNLTKIKWFLKWARRKGLYSGTADQTYRPKIKGADQTARSIVYLTRDELQKLEQCEFKERHYNVTRDVFLFCCYTGLRTSDILVLSRADCFPDHISFTTKKTNHALTIPLNDKAKAILDKYKGCAPNRRQRSLGIMHPALPTPDRKTANKNIHHVMRLACIDTPVRHTYYIGSVRHDDVVPKYELISTHTARHTFIVTAISLGIHTSIIMEWTGHKDFNAMRPYIAIANDTSVQAMQLFNQL